MFNSKSHRVFAAALALAAVSAGSPALADVIFQTATPGSGGTGDYAVYNTSDAGTGLIGVTFSTSAVVNAMQIGAFIQNNAFTNNNGTVFAEVVSVASLSTVPSTGGDLSGWLTANNLGRGVITLPASGPSGDVLSSAISFAGGLKAGTYAVIFGTGLFGTSGEMDLADGNATLGAPNFFNTFGDVNFSGYDGTDTGMRVFAQTPVPLPAALPLLGSALTAGMAFVRRRRAIRVAP